MTNLQQQIKDLEIGSIVDYRPNGGGRRRVEVDDLGDTENGYPVFGGIVTRDRMEGEGVWGYLSQITQVVAQ